MITIFACCKVGNRFIFGTFKYTAIFVSIFIMFGCTETRVIVNPDVNKDKYDDYELVYLRAPDSKDKDPRNIFPLVLDKLEDLGFQVRVINKENPMEGRQGSGFVVDPKGYVLTCAHIFGKERKASLWIRGKRYVADVVETDKSNDLALLKINSHQLLDLKSLPIFKDFNYKMGEDVYTIGFPLSNILGNTPRLNKGLISSIVGLKDDPNHLQISVEIQPGNSGSPLLNKNGVVVGIIQGTLNPINVLAKTRGSLPQNVNFALKTDAIHAFIKKAKDEIIIDFDSSEKLEFDRVSDSVVQIRSGIITEDFLKKPKLFCRVAYQSFWDIGYRFRFFQIQLYDLGTGKLLLKAGQYGDAAFSTEEKVIDETFEQVRTHFSPKDKNASSDKTN